MNSEPKTLGVVLGGASVEHTISIRSARAVIGAANPDRWRTIPFAVSRSGRWLDPIESQAVMHAIHGGAREEITEPEEPGRAPISPQTTAALLECDAVFPLIHGSTGEDGVLQGFLETLDLAYVGSSVAASAIAMDKARCKQILTQAGVPVAPWISVSCSEWRADSDAVIRRAAEIGYPQFVKPSRGGSSIGISRVDSREEIRGAIEAAVAFDSEVLIEEAMPSPRELECGILGSLGEGPLLVSPPGEIRTGRDFYDYTAKYEDPDTDLIAPADIDDETARRLRDMSVQAWNAVGIEGMVRADFLLGPDDQLWLGELNTIPGFTSASMYPLLLEATGLPMTALVDRLVELGVDRHQRRTRHLGQQERAADP
ncbi:MAG: D-alanine--D-alanine ligase [Chloroflexota bacterium]|nr:D-alanine--D-alanine ligase [Chloroflexota bacterium]MDE2894154.1 D-alanine--D-alanine ligase [Chloroflexota bacterium]